MRIVVGAAIAACVIVALGAAYALGADQKKSQDQPKSRADWPTEKVIVIGRRGNPRDWIANHTFRGSEGFSDGSAPPESDTRTDYPWQIYYAVDGTLEARFRRLASPVVHGPIQETDFVEKGTWRITPEEGDLCQTIPRVGYGTEICYWLDRRGDRMAMYYTNCGHFERCYPGRLGPEGEIVPGRAFTR